MTATGTHADVHYADLALARIAAHLARSTPGVFGLAPMLGNRLRAGAARGLPGGAERGDAAAVTVTRRGGGIVLAVRIITGLDPAPIDVVRALGRALTGEVSRLTGAEVSAEVTVAGVHP